MTAAIGGGLAERQGRSDPIGFRAVIKAVGTGPRGSRALSFEEARAATAALLGGEISPVQAGAFLVAMRMKGETPAELAGVAQALRDAARTVAPELPAGTRPIVACAGAYDGITQAPHLSLAAAVLGMEGADVLRAARPSAADAAGPLDIAQSPGDALRGDADPQVSAELTRAIAAGAEHGVAGRTALLSAGVRLYAAGRCDNVDAGAALASAAVADGRAAATLEALLAA